MPELKDKLDTSVNGPEDPRPVFPAFDGDAWERVDWRRCEEEVRRLRSRIFKAVQEGDMATAVDLQKLMLRSWHNTLVSVRQVTQRNTGRKTAGIDGLVALTSQARAEMAVRVHATRGSHQPSPVRRVYIPKASDKAKMRPLGIPVILDRCHQARVRNALEPEWEARFEPRSYGFRPGRGRRDAIGSLFNTLRGKGKRVWILDVGLASAFDKIDHEHPLKAIGSFPARGMIAGWLRAGIFEAGPGQFALHPPVPPRGILRRHADHQLAGRGHRGRPPGTPTARVVPLARDKLAVPGEQGRGCHRVYLAPTSAGDQLRQCGKPQPVARLVTDPVDLATQDGVLVPEHQELGVLGQLAPGQHRQAAEQAAYKQVDDRNDHSAMIPALLVRPGAIQ